MGNARVVAGEASRGQILKGLVITAKNLGFILKAMFLGATHSSPKCFKLDSNPIRCEYLNDHFNYSVVIRLGTGLGSGCGSKTSYKAIRGNLVYPGAG